jgi:hypothetical protein
MDDVLRMEDIGNACRILVGKSERITLFGKYRRTWVDNTRTCLQQIGSSDGILRTR